MQNYFLAKQRINVHLGDLRITINILQIKEIKTCFKSCALGSKITISKKRTPAWRRESIIVETITGCVLNSGAPLAQSLIPTISLGLTRDTQAAATVGWTVTLVTTSSTMRLTSETFTL